MRLILRAVLGGMMGIFVGENPIATGLLAGPLFLPMLVWYIFLFLTFDWLIFRFKLSDRSFVLLAAVFAILIGGILDKEFFTPTPQMGIFGLDPLSTLLNTLWWGVSYILIFHLINCFLPRKEVLLGKVAGAVFLALTLFLMGPGLPATLASVNPVGLTLLSTLALGFFIRFNRIRLSTNPDMRPVIQRSFKLAAIPLLFIFLSTIFSPVGYILLSAGIVIIILLLMFSHKIAI